MLLSVVVSYLLPLLLLYTASGSLLPGEICQLNDGVGGMCRHVHTCASAIRELQMKKRPKTCGYDGSIPVVCCREDHGSTPTTTPKEELYVSKGSEQDYGKVSAEKCNSYAGLVFANYSSPTLLPHVLFEIEDTCAIKKENYNESTVLAREFPHLASIGYESTAGQVWKCAGALISDKYVLTAATCFYLPKLGMAKYVRVGSTSARENFYHEKPLQYSNIKNFIKHPRFDQSSLVNNVALVELETPVSFTSIVRPACIGVGKKRPEEAINVGWGTFGINTYLNNEPLKNLVRIIDSRYCNGMRANQFCVGQVPGSLWQNCLVDQGSPLQIYNEDKYCTYDIIGVVSDWTNCYKSKPGIYTNISTHIPWIEKTVWG